MSELTAKVSCTYCQEEINGLRIQCCVCSDFELCLQCFATGAEIGPHRNDHSYTYRFIDDCAVGIFGGKSNWTGREELRLLEAMDLYGFGNWDAVSEHIETRTAEEARDEYIARYLDGNIGKATWAEVSNRRPEIVDNTIEDKGPLAPSVMAKLPPLDITPEEAALLGYFSHRDDYEREYDMTAEFLVISLQLNDSLDSNADIGLKLAQVDMYTRRLRERARRKRIVRDYQLAAKYFRKDTKHMLTKDQRELRDSFRVFSQFLTSGEHERLIDSIDREKELRFRLSELIKYRTLGLTTQEELIHYEQHVAYQHLDQIRQNKAARVNRKSHVNRSHRLYQFTFHLGQQWLHGIKPSSRNKRTRKRRGIHFSRRKIHRPSRRRLQRQLQHQLQQQLEQHQQLGINNIATI